MPDDCPRCWCGGPRDPDERDCSPACRAERIGAPVQQRDRAQLAVLGGYDCDEPPPGTLDGFLDLLDREYTPGGYEPADQEDDGGWDDFGGLPCDN